MVSLSSSSSAGCLLTILLSSQPKLDHFASNVYLYLETNIFVAKLCYLLATMHANCDIHLYMYLVIVHMKGVHITSSLVYVLNDVFLFWELLPCIYK